MHQSRRSLIIEPKLSFVFIVFIFIVFASIRSTQTDAQYNSNEVQTMNLIDASSISSSEIIVSWTPPPPPINDNHDAVKVSYFYKPDEDPAKLIDNVDHFIYTKNDEDERDVLEAAGKSMVLQYLRFDSIHDPCHLAVKSSSTTCGCDRKPNNNNVGWNPSDVCMIRDQHPDWFLRDYRGRIMYYENYVFMDPGHPGWQQFWLERVRYSQLELGWDGVFLDNMAYQFGRHHNNPIDLQKYPDDESYVAAVTSFLKYVYEGFFEPEGRLLYSNVQAGYHGSPAFFSYLEYLDGVMDEFWGVDWTNTGYYSEKSFDVRVDRIETAMKMGKGAFLISQGNKNDYNRQRFALSTYLLIDQGKASFRYTDDKIYGEMWLYDNYDLPLGSPLGDRYRDGEVWRRDFTNGRVSVNPIKKTSNIEVYNNSSQGTPSTTSIELHRSTDGINFSLVNTLSSDSQSIIDNGLVADTQYCYRVRAVYSNNAKSDWLTADCTKTQAINQAPVINNIGNQMGTVGIPVALQLNATDAESSDLFYQVINLPDGLQADPITGLITGQPTTAGTSTVTVNVEDNHNATTSTTFDWAIVLPPEPTNDNTGGGQQSPPNPTQPTDGEDGGKPQPAPNLPPQIVSPGNQSTLKGTGVSLAIQATDPENTPMSFSATGLPEGLLIDFSTGLISGQPTQAGIFNVALSVYDQDAENSASVSIQWTVTEPPTPVETTTPPDTSGSIAVVALTLVNANTNNDIMAITNGTTIYLNSLPTQNINIRADVTSDVQSVSFNLNSGQYKNVENKAPYAFKGDNNGDYKPWSLPTGEHTLVVTGNSKTKMEGNSGQALAITFTVAESAGSVVIIEQPSPTPDPVDPPNNNGGENPDVVVVPVDPPNNNGGENPDVVVVPVDPPQNNSGVRVTRLVLVNADTNQDIMTLNNNMVIDLNSLPTRNFNIRAEVSGNVKSLKFTGSKSRVENVAPYTIAGDNNGNYDKWTMGSGNYTVTATPYEQTKASGSAGAALTISFVLQG